VKLSQRDGVNLSDQYPFTSSQQLALLSKRLITMIYLVRTSANRVVLKALFYETSSGRHQCLCRPLISWQFSPDKRCLFWHKSSC